MRTDFGPKTTGLPTPIVVVGSYDENNRPNAMTAAWTGICASVPPAVMVCINENHQTAANIRQCNEFTVHVPGSDQVTATDYYGISSGKAEDKFSHTGHTISPSSRVHAPIINEFPIVMECRVHSRLQMGPGMVLVGEILNLSVDDDYLKTDSKGQPAIDFAKVAPFIYNQADATYHTIGAPLAKAFSEGKKGTD
ncbi:flavin reductase family protein [Peptococcus simiae]|uniref:flavin reductase family protein n=1 Tax=Peptococcus simiae TaxID=1643805 RepID=UPI0039815D2C